MDVTLEFDTRYPERKREKNHNHEKNTKASTSISSNNQSSPSSSHKKKNFMAQKRDKPHFCLLNRDHKLMGTEKERIIKEGLCAYFGGKNSLEACFKSPQNQLTQTSDSFSSQGNS
ncbi:hypothetical protein O181_117108 [Austropuccinia psidii MF-1]|uniref:Uncharacterized protein n=1 Tax=Austropuccinia psidii MF-1 TaxID=1389203 RepID=A0A9Q3K9K4_9BASI|nr:hypothetical protein [Austropuccinia psidii MF-1]